MFKRGFSSVITVALFYMYCYKRCPFGIREQYGACHCSIHKVSRKGCNVVFILCDLQNSRAEMPVSSWFVFKLTMFLQQWAMLIIVHDMSDNEEEETVSSHIV